MPPRLVAQQPPQQQMDLDPKLLEDLATEIRSFIEERIGALPAPQTPVINVQPSAAAPTTVNVQPAMPEVQVSVQPTPVNVSATAPIVNVSPTPINIESPSHVVNVEPTPIEVNVDQSQVARAVAELVSSCAANTRAITTMAEAVSEQSAAIRALAAALTAPRSIVTDADGKPIGMRTAT